MGTEGFPAERAPQNPGIHKIGAALSGPRIGGRKITDIKFFLFVECAVSTRMVAT